MAIKDPGDQVGSLAIWPPRSGSVIKIYDSAQDYHISIVKISKKQFILKNDRY